MRSFSALKEHCNYPELIDLAVPMSAARQKSCDVGTEFHGAVEAWVKGEPQPVLTSKDARGWLATMERVWTPPDGCETEVALGITTDGRAVEVDEPEPHVYASKTPGEELITAGRLDLRWMEGKTRVVVDVKSGRSFLGDPFDIPQLIAQAVAQSLMDAQNGVDSELFKLGVYYARLGLFHFQEKPTREVPWLLDYVRYAAEASNEPRPGAHCLTCYSASNCPANPAKKVG